MAQSLEFGKFFDQCQNCRYLFAKRGLDSQVIWNLGHISNRRHIQGRRSWMPILQAGFKSEMIFPFPDGSKNLDRIGQRAPCLTRGGSSDRSGAST